MKYLLTTAITLALFVSALAMAQPPYVGGGPRGDHGPPREAVEACATVEQGEACNFSGRDGDTLSGTCEVVRGDQLACVPENAPRHGR